MAESTEVVIGNADAQHVAVRPLSWSQARLFDDGGRDCIDCEFRIAGGAFRGEIRADVKADEFRRFLEEVEALRRGGDAAAATLNAAEGQMAMSLRPDGAEQMHVEGTAIDDASSGNRLHFRFDFDRAALPEICRSLEHLLAAYPSLRV